MKHARAWWGKVELFRALFWGMLLAEYVPSEEQFLLFSMAQYRYKNRFLESSVCETPAERRLRNRK
jgi:hypothetical protein